MLGVIKIHALLALAFSFIFFSLVHTNNIGYLLSIWWTPWFVPLQNYLRMLTVSYHISLYSLTEYRVSLTCSVKPLIKCYPPFLLMIWIYYFGIRALNHNYSHFQCKSHWLWGTTELEWSFEIVSIFRVPFISYTYKLKSTIVDDTDNLWALNLVLEERQYHGSNLKIII